MELEDKLSKYAFIFIIWLGSLCVVSQCTIHEATQRCENKVKQIFTSKHSHPITLISDDNPERAGFARDYEK